MMIEKEEMQSEMSTDWLGSKPVFFHERTGRISHNINRVIDYRNLEFDEEGLRDYLDYGYSVYGYTPVKHVRFLAPNSSIRCVDKQFSMLEHPDIAEGYFGRETKVSELIDQTRQLVQQWEREQTERIVVPVSGGYDSRYLLSLIADRTRVDAYTYGYAPNQPSSYEVRVAREICERLGVNWQQVFLGEFHKEIYPWYDMMGVSTHAHGMYQIEFFNNLMNTHLGAGVLSGIFGDVWAGSVATKHVSSPGDLRLISYNHGLQASGYYPRYKVGYAHRDAYWEVCKDRINDPFWQIVYLIRQKMILIQFLLSVPARFNMNVWSPFLDPEIALGMLTLPDHERQNRKWQSDYFDSNGLYIRKPLLGFNTANTLFLQALRISPLEPLSESILSEIFERSYIERINSALMTTSWYASCIDRLCGLPVFRMGDILRRLNMDQRWRAYNAYMTIKPLELLIIKRNQA